MDTIVDKVVSRDGTAIGYERVGSGPPVILVGGAFCDRHFSGPLPGLLAPDFTVVSYDRRGRGASGDTLPYAVEREIEDLDALIGVAGGEAYLFGVSSGAVLCLEAAMSGLAVRGLALVEPPYQVEGGRELPDLGDRYAELCAAGRPGDAVGLFMTEAVGQPPEAVEQARATPMWPALEAMAPTLAYDAKVTDRGLPPAEKAATVTVPVLALASAASPGWLHGGAEALGRLLPNARYLVLDGEFHSPRTELVAEELRKAFLG